MPRQNRVQPTGEILAVPERGAFLGNRGILHDDTAHQHGLLTHRRWRHKAWVCCVLEFKNRRRKLMSPNRYTELFFHDEAVALAAGHRPCGECRRADYKAFLAAAGHAGRVAGFDNQLHAARAIPRSYGQRRHETEAGFLPDGSFVLVETGPALIWQDALHPFTASGYGTPQTKPAGRVCVLTPEPTLKALRAGFIPIVRLP
ncbi:hypothetical protein BXY66_1270 [Shimia isoporae]|uniref:Metal binding Ada-like protein n=1 Tax=Shimia isoporae TaxID=647720 RepID=A0A4R1NM61_9RHOB|nr:hypothetical protein [Shimia isoporae]TCL09225.1 hypothetical protein BXY66_1270 [Shimia isoporae]